MVKHEKNLVHYVVVTGIIVSEGKYLIVKRADWEKAFPGKWTVPGGKLEVLDYCLNKKDTKHHWYNVLEKLLKKEVREEVNLEIKNIGYVTSMVYIRPDNIPCLIISLFAEKDKGEIFLDKSLTEYAWVDIDEAKEYDSIEGIYDELVILDNFLNNGKEMTWEKINKPGEDK